MVQPTVQQEQSSGGGVRRRSLESPMRESQARTKVVLRHLPPTMAHGVLLEYLDSKFAGSYTWFSFRPGKASAKKQVLSRAYINFKKPEDVYNFCESFDGHVFVNQKGTPYKVTVEYAPYQRTPKPRSKKDIREGTIFKDPDYLEFLGGLGKPLEYLPSAEIQLERREAEKAAALGANGGKESVVVTPLMEFVRQRRAAKATPQRSLSSKVGARPGGIMVASSSLGSHKRGIERVRPGSVMDYKEVHSRDHIGSSRREEQHQRKDRDVITERKRRDVVEDGELKVNERIAVDGDVSSAIAIMSGKSSGEGMHGDPGKEVIKRDVLKKKHLLLMKDKAPKDSVVGPSSQGNVAVAGCSSNNQRHRPPVSPRVASPHVQTQLAMTGEGSAGTPVTKSRRDISGRGSSRGGLSPRDQQSPSQPRTSSHAVHLDSGSQQGSPQSDRGGKRPPRPQSARLAGKEQLSTGSAQADSDGQSTSGQTGTEEKSSNAMAVESFPNTERQDSRRVRNKDRPDRPVWTPRRRSDTVPSLDASSAAPAASLATMNLSDTVDLSKGEKAERGIQRNSGKIVSDNGKGADSHSRSVDYAESGKSQHISGSVSAHGSGSGKGRYIESGGTRGGRTARVIPANQEHSANHGEHRVDSGSRALTESKITETNALSAKENGECQVSAHTEKEKRKHESTSQWTETGGGHRIGERRRERVLHQGFKDTDGTVPPADLNKPVKRGGNPASGGNEKQVWVAVQKSGAGT